METLPKLYRDCDEVVFLAGQWTPEISVGDLVVMAHDGCLGLNLSMIGGMPAGIATTAIHPGDKVALIPRTGKLRALTAEEWADIERRAEETRRSGW